MAFLTPNHDKLIAAAETRLTQLQTELAESQGMVERYCATATRLAVEGNDNNGRERAEKAMLAAQGSAKISAGAIALVEARLAGHIADRDAQADKAQRHASANEVEALLVESGAIVREGEAFFKHLEAWCAKVAPNIPEAGRSEELAIALKVKIPEEIVLYQKLLGYLGSAILAGTAAPTLKRRDAPVVNTAPPAPVLTTIFAVRSFKWTNPSNGRLIVVQRFTDTELPPIFAAAALASGVACRLDDPRCKQRNTVGGHGEPGHAFDLDAAMAAKAAGPRLVEPIKQSNPQFVETIGQPKKAFIS